jgi:hypothetical protein
MPLWSIELNPLFISGCIAGTCAPEGTLALNDPVATATHTVSTEFPCLVPLYTRLSMGCVFPCCIMACDKRPVLFINSHLYINLNTPLCFFF